MTNHKNRRNHHRDGMINCHYVPQFILRHFGKTVDVFNVRTQQYQQGCDPYDIFSIPDLYPAGLETRLNELMENDSSDRLMKKILNVKGDVVLTRKDLLLFKRFFAMGLIRCPDTLNSIRRFREYLTYERCVQAFGEYVAKRYVADFITNETDEQYWYRTMESILQVKDFNPETVFKCPSSTLLAYNWSIAFAAGYFAFWDAPEDVDFVITDVGMTSELEPPGGPETGKFINRKEVILYSWNEYFSQTASKDPLLFQQVKEQNDQLMLWQHYLFENFYMFPLSSKRMAVLVNPFFKTYIQQTRECPWLEVDLSALTKMPRLDVFSPNEAEKMLLDEERDMRDVYRYHPVKLWTEEAVYCNALFMDQVQEYLGFTSLDSIRSSVIE